MITLCVDLINLKNSETDYVRTQKLQKKFGHCPNSIIVDNMFVFDFYIFNILFSFFKKKQRLLERFSCWTGLARDNDLRFPINIEKLKMSKTNI